MRLTQYISKKLFFTLLFVRVAHSLFTQNYVDVAQVYVRRAPLIHHQEDGLTTTLKEKGANMTLPIVTESGAIIAGVNYANHQLHIKEKMECIGLNTMALKLGKSFPRFGTVVLVPKISSDMHQIGKSDFQFGALVLGKVHPQPGKVSLNGGLYVGSEAYGTLISPLLRLYFIDKSNRFELNATLPASLNANYKVLPRTKLGMDFKAINQGFNLTGKGLESQIIHNKSNRLSSYLEYRIGKGLLLRANAGYATNDFALYDGEEQIVAISALDIGKRTRLNNKSEGSLFYEISVSQRIHF